MDRTPSVGSRRITDLGELLGEVGRRAEQATVPRAAIVDGHTSISYPELLAAGRGFAAGLSAMGVGRGDVVLLQLPNWWETIAAMLGAWERGAVTCPVVSIYREHSRGAHLRFDRIAHGDDDRPL